MERVRTTRAKRDHLRLRKPWGQKETKESALKGHDGEVYTRDEVEGSEQFSLQEQEC